MAQVTIELRRLLTTDFELFDFDYNFDDPEFKKKLENDVINFYYDYEIGQETPDMFKRKFKAKWTRIIPYYNKLYNTTLLKYNPLTNYSTLEAYNQLQNSEVASNNEGKSTSGNTQTNDLKNNNNETTSDYPQQSIAGTDFASGSRQAENLSTGTVNNDGQVTSEDNTKQEGKTENKYNKTIEGITGITYQDLIQKERDSLIRITNMIINELKSLFILVY